VRVVSDEPDKRLELAYDAGEKKLAMQDSTLANVRTRANNLLATAALFTSFSAGVGLINTDRTKGAVLSPCAGIALLVVLILLGISVLYVVFPAPNWQFVPSASKILEMYDQGKGETFIRKTVIAAMIKGGNDNQPKLDRRQWAFRLAALLLLCEIAILVWILIAK
jgi:hypothetical protein